MGTRLHRACLPNPSCAVPFTFIKTVRRGRLQRPRGLRFLLPNRPTTTFGISASLLVSEFGPWLRGSLFLRSSSGLPESLEPRTRPARQRPCPSQDQRQAPLGPLGPRAAASPGIREGGRAGVDWWARGRGDGGPSGRNPLGEPRKPRLALRVGRC